MPSKQSCNDLSFPQIACQLDQKDMFCNYLHSEKDLYNPHINGYKKHMESGYIYFSLKKCLLAWPMSLRVAENPRKKKKCSIARSHSCNIYILFSRTQTDDSNNDQVEGAHWTWHHKVNCGTPLMQFYIVKRSSSIFTCSWRVFTWTTTGFTSNSGWVFARGGWVSNEDDLHHFRAISAVRYLS